MMISNAFTCTGPYAILILYGIKRTENRSAWPEPSDLPSQGYGGRVGGWRFHVRKCVVIYARGFKQ